MGIGVARGTRAEPAEPAGARMAWALCVRKPGRLQEVAAGPSALWAATPWAPGLSVLCSHILLLTAPLPLSRPGSL